MKFEILYNKDRKIIFYCLIAGVILLITLIVCPSLAKYKKRESIPLVKGNINYSLADFNLLAMYQENENGEYVEIEIMPTSGYIINKELSYCTLKGITDTFAVLETIDSKHTISNLQKGSKCYLYFDEYIDAKEEIKSIKPSGLTTSLVGELYRFQGSSPNNYICFGTSDKSTCLGDPDVYMYRIIGMSSSGVLKLIKSTVLGSYAWHTTYKEDTLWQNSSLFTALNGTTFLDNTTYIPTNWKSKIVKYNWKNGDMGDTSIYNLSASQIYTNEKTYLLTTSAYIGLMNLSDYALSVSSNVNCYNNTNCESSWMNLNNTLSSSREWTMIRNEFYDSPRLYVWYIGIDGDYTSDDSINVATSINVRPVFYIEKIAFSSGTGTSVDPFIVTI